MIALLRRMVMVGAIVATAGAASAHAQVTEAMKFKTTFPFTVSGSSFPAGSYTLRPLDLEPGLMTISNDSVTRFLRVIPVGANPNVPTKDEVVFTKQGESYTLSQIWDSADHSGVEAIPMKTRAHESRRAHHG